MTVSSAFLPPSPAHLAFVAKAFLLDRSLFWSRDPFAPQTRKHFRHFLQVWFFYYYWAAGRIETHCTIKALWVCAVMTTLLFTLLHSLLCWGNVNRDSRYYIIHRSLDRRRPGTTDYISEPPACSFPSWYDVKKLLLLTLFFK